TEHGQRTRLVRLAMDVHLRRTARVYAWLLDVALSTRQPEPGALAHSGGKAGVERAAHRTARPRRAHRFVACTPRSSRHDSLDVILPADCRNSGRDAVAAADFEAACALDDRHRVDLGRA